MDLWRQDRGRDMPQDTPPGQDIDVFISCKREERALATQVAGALEAAGYTQVTDLNLANSTHFGDEIDRLIRRSRVVLVLWTEASVASDWVKSEARLGRDLGTYLGVMVEPVELPVDLRYLQAEVLDAPLTDSLPRIVGAVREMIGPAQESPAAATTRSTALNDDLLFFQTAERADSLTSFRAYLDAFPSGAMADEARRIVRQKEEEARRRKTLWFRLRQRLPGPALVLTFFSTSFAAAGLWLNYAAQPTDPLRVMAENRALRTENETLATRPTAEAETLRDTVARLEGARRRAERPFRGGSGRGRG